MQEERQPSELRLTGVGLCVRALDSDSNISYITHRLLPRRLSLVLVCEESRVSGPSGHPALAAGRGTQPACPLMHPCHVLPVWDQLLPCCCRRGCNVVNPTSALRPRPSSATQWLPSRRVALRGPTKRHLTPPLCHTHVAHLFHIYSEMLAPGMNQPHQQHVCNPGRAVTEVNIEERRGCRHTAAPDASAPAGGGGAKRGLRTRCAAVGAARR